MGSHEGDDHIVVGDYDVLVHYKESVSRDNSEQADVCLSLYQPQKADKLHVGNNRYQVFINMHKSEFEQARNAQDDTSTIVNRIIDIVTAQCEPRGRFLLKRESVEETAEVEWDVLSNDQLEGFVSSSLSTPSRRHSKLLPLSHNLAPPIMDFDEDDFDDEDDDDGDDDKKKRGRRPSLLRRSVSDSNVPATDSKKKTLKADDGTDSGGKARRRGSGMRRWRSSLTMSSRRRPSKLDVIESEEFIKEDSDEISEVDDKAKEQEQAPAVEKVSEVPIATAGAKANTVASESKSSNSSTGSDIGKAEKVTELNPLDVIFRSSGVLRAGRTGNNRLQVLMDIKRAGYLRSDHATKNRMVKDLAQVVSTHWKGRFVREDGENFVSLHPSTVESLLRSNLETVNDDDESVTNVSFAGTSVAGASVSSMSVSSVSVKMNPEDVKKQAFEAILKLAPPVEDTEAHTMQRTAVQLLQKKKERQGLASKIRHLATATLRGESIGSIGSSGDNQSVSFGSAVNGDIPAEVLSGQGFHADFSNHTFPGDLGVHSNSNPAVHRDGVVMQDIPPGVLDQLLAHSSISGPSSQRSSFAIPPSDQGQIEHNMRMQQRPSLIVSQQGAPQYDLSQFPSEPQQMQQRMSITMSGMQQKQQELQMLQQQLLQQNADICNDLARSAQQNQQQQPLFPEQQFEEQPGLQDINGQDPHFEVQQLEMPNQFEPGRRSSLLDVVNEDEEDFRFGVSSQGSL